MTNNSNKGTLIQCVGRDPKGIIRHDFVRSDVLRFRDFTGWTALTFRDLDRGCLVTPQRAGNGR